MDTFEQVWETSQTNSWSWGYPATLWLGAIVICALALIHKTWIRRSLTVTAILAFTFLATELSSHEIQEKWRIRGEWAKANKDQLTDTDRSALQADGANLALAPFFYGFRAMLLFVAVSVAVFFLRKIGQSCKTQATVSS